MNVMLKFLAVVALFATGNANFFEFSEDAFNVFSTANVKVGPINAEVINLNSEFKFHLVSDEGNEEDKFLFLDILPESADGHGHSICGNDLGIHIEEAGTFCNTLCVHVGIHSFVVPSSYENYGESDESYVPDDDEEVTSGAKDKNEAPGHKNEAAEEISKDELDKREKVFDSAEKILDEKTMHITIFFDSTKSKPCSLEIPIFKIPSSVDSSNIDNLKTWANENKVGLLPPTDFQKLIAVRKNSGLTTDFKWLSDVLKYGIYETEGDSGDLSTDTEGDSEDLSTDTEGDSEDLSTVTEGDKEDLSTSTESDSKDLSTDNEDLSISPYAEIAKYTSRPIVLSEDDMEKLKAWLGGVYSESFKE